MSKKPIKICLISFNSYPLFEKKSKGYFGGAEVQISLMAKELAKDKDFKINLVVGDYSQRALIKKNNLNIYKTFHNVKHYSRTLVNFVYLLTKIKADVYIERTLNIRVGLTALWCKLRNKKFIYMVAHDWDCQPDLGGYLKGLSKQSFLFGLKQADLIIAQTKKQQQSLVKNHKIKAKLIRSLCKTKSVSNKWKQNTILWVGRADEWKRPLTFIKLASQFPEQKFVMVCRKGNNSKYFAKVKAKTNRFKNIKFLTVVPFEQIIKLYAQAKILVNTSEAEGFPNTFLQAGLTKTPILSLDVNPDGYIDKYKCGVYSNHSEEKLIEGCRRLLNQPKLRQSTGKNNYLYVKKYHGLGNILEFKKALVQVV